MACEHQPFRYECFAAICDIEDASSKLFDCNTLLRMEREVDPRQQRIGASKKQQSPWNDGCTPSMCADSDAGLVELFESAHNQ